MAVDKEKNTQVLVTFPNDMLQEIENHWYENRFKNRNEAIRDLVDKGLKDSRD